jgi:uncharacterized YccA/Bax inhibitor family protein
VAEASARSPALNQEVFEKQARIASGAEPMTIAGVVRACGVLLAIVLGAGVAGWTLIDPDPATITIPVWYWIALGGGLVIAIVTIVRPRWAVITSPVYAALEGLVVGALSRLFEFEFDGIVLQAVALTVGVFAVMLILYATRTIEVTENLRLGIIAATGAVLVVYVVDLVLLVFGHRVPFIHDTGPIGIGVSVVIVIIAALNLVLDFDFIERGADLRAPAYMNWYAAFGLLVTLIWLYLELLRLLAKARRS